VTDEAVLAYCAPRLRPQPWKAMVEPVIALADFPEHVTLSYVICTEPENASFRAVYDRLRTDPRWETHELATTHFAPLTNPDGVSRLIARDRATKAPG